MRAAPDSRSEASRPRRGVEDERAYLACERWRRKTVSCSAAGRVESSTAADGRGADSSWRARRRGSIWGDEDCLAAQERARSS